MCGMRGVACEVPLVISTARRARRSGSEPRERAPFRVQKCGSNQRGDRRCVTVVCGIWFSQSGGSLGKHSYSTVHPAGR